MNSIQRICPQCGQAGSLEARYCARCGFDSQSALPTPMSNLPMVARAALPVLITAAGIALRAGWRLLQSRWAQEAARKAVNMAVQPASPKPVAPATETDLPAGRRKRVIHIRSIWAEGDANGVWREGSSEQRIEIDE
jgi:hypothetical protein